MSIVKDEINPRAAHLWKPKQAYNSSQIDEECCTDFTIRAYVKKWSAQHKVMGFSRLLNLELQEQGLGNYGCKVLFLCLLHSKLELDVVKLWKNQIGDFGAESIAYYISSSPFPMSECHLSDNYITEKGLFKIISAVSQAAIKRKVYPQITLKSVKRMYENERDQHAKKFWKGSEGGAQPKFPQPMLPYSVQDDIRIKIRSFYLRIDNNCLGMRRGFNERREVLDAWSGPERIAKLPKKMKISDFESRLLGGGNAPKPDGSYEKITDLSKSQDDGGFTRVGADGGETGGGGVSMSWKSFGIEAFSFIAETRDKNESLACKEKHFSLMKCCEVAQRGQSIGVATDYKAIQGNVAKDHALRDIPRVYNCDNGGTDNDTDEKAYFLQNPYHEKNYNFKNEVKIPLDQHIPVYNLRVAKGLSAYIDSLDMHRKSVGADLPTDLRFSEDLTKWYVCPKDLSKDPLDPKTKKIFDQYPHNARDLVRDSLPNNFALINLYGIWDQRRCKNKFVNPPIAARIDPHDIIKKEKQRRADGKVAKKTEPVAKNSVFAKDDLASHIHGKDLYDGVKNVMSVEKYLITGGQNLTGEIGEGDQPALTDGSHNARTAGTIIKSRPADPTVRGAGVGSRSAWQSVPLPQGYSVPPWSSSIPSNIIPSGENTTVVEKTQDSPERKNSSSFATSQSVNATPNQSVNQSVNQQGVDNVGVPKPAVNQGVNNVGVPKPAVNQSVNAMGSSPKNVPATSQSINVEKEPGEGGEEFVKRQEGLDTPENQKLENHRLKTEVEEELRQQRAQQQLRAAEEEAERLRREEEAERLRREEEAERLRREEEAERLRREEEAERLRREEEAERLRLEEEAERLRKEEEAERLRKEEEAERLRREEEVCKRKQELYEYIYITGDRIRRKEEEKRAAAANLKRLQAQRAAAQANAHDGNGNCRAFTVQKDVDCSYAVSTDISSKNSKEEQNVSPNGTQNPAVMKPPVPSSNSAAIAMNGVAGYGAAYDEYAAGAAYGSYVASQHYAAGTYYGSAGTYYGPPGTHAGTYHGTHGGPHTAAAHHAPANGQATPHATPNDLEHAAAVAQVMAGYGAGHNPMFYYPETASNAGSDSWETSVQNLGKAVAPSAPSQTLGKSAGGVGKSRFDTSGVATYRYDATSSRTSKCSGGKSRYIPIKPGKGASTANNDWSAAASRGVIHSANDWSHAKGTWTSKSSPSWQKGGKWTSGTNDWTGDWGSNYSYPTRRDSAHSSAYTPSIRPSPIGPSSDAGALTNDVKASAESANDATASAVVKDAPEGAKTPSAGDESCKSNKSSGKVKHHPLGDFVDSETDSDDDVTSLPKFHDSPGNVMMQRNESTISSNSSVSEAVIDPLNGY